jgi:hypothetical protein
MHDPASEDPAPAAPGPLRQFTVLRTQHAKLHVERDHLVVNVKRNIVAGFQRKLGAHDHAFKKAEWEVERLKRELELVRNSARNGEVDYDSISGALEEEFTPQEQQIDDAPRQMEMARQRLNTMMTREQTAIFQARYRRLVELLHPDLRFTENTTAANLWARARDSYAAGDAPELEAIEILAADLPREDLDALPVAEIQARVARLKCTNEAVINELAAMRLEWPFPLAAKLPDEEWLKSQRAEYEQKTAALIAERKTLVAELNHILDTRPSGHE